MSAGQDDLNLSNGETKLLLDDDDDDAPKPLPLLLDEKAQALVANSTSRVTRKKGVVSAMFVQENKQSYPQCCDAIDGEL